MGLLCLPWNHPEELSHASPPKYFSNQSLYPCPLIFTVKVYFGSALSLLTAVPQINHVRLPHSWKVQWSPPISGPATFCPHPSTVSESTWSNPVVGSLEISTKTEAAILLLGICHSDTFLYM